MSYPRFFLLLVGFLDCCTSHQYIYVFHFIKIISSYLHYLLMLISLLNIFFQLESLEDFIHHRKNMNDKKNSTKFEDYLEPKTATINMVNTCGTINKSMSQFKLDRILPKSINIKLYLEGKENTIRGDKMSGNKLNNHSKGTNCYENKFYQQYVSLKEDHLKNKNRKSKISHIFNIRSINLLDKVKNDDFDKQKLKPKMSSKQFRRNHTEKFDRDDLKGLNFVLVDKKDQSPDIIGKKIPERRITNNQLKLVETKVCGPQKSSEDKFDIKLNEYYQYLREICQSHGLTLKEVQGYGKHTINFNVGKGNNGALVKEALKKRWWWTMAEEKNKKPSNLIWTQLKEKSYYIKKDNRSISTASQSVSKRSESPCKNRQNSKEKIMSVNQQQWMDVLIHNHFENNEYLGNKKALFYNMKSFYQKQKKYVFDYLPITFHVKQYEDEAWKEFTNYFQEDLQKHQGEKRLWIVKPGENSNRGNGITIYSEYEKVRQYIEIELSSLNSSKKTFIIQKYIDKPLLYNKRKFDIRCYMLLVRLNGSIKGYWYSQGYIRTSCYDYQCDDTENNFIHLTNDAIQVNCQKYGKYEDGNKLSYHNFQKYLDNNHKGGHNFVEEIIPQLKKIATDSVEASYHLLGKWNNLPTFEIFGLDFMIDEHFKPWLIEINTNPCLQTTSTTTQRVIPRMVDNALKLSVDILFPPPFNWQNSKKHYLPNRVSNNLFELIFDESKRTSGIIMRDEIIMQMGEIEQDNEIYDDNCEKEQNKTILVYHPTENE